MNTRHHAVLCGLLLVLLAGCTGARAPDSASVDFEGSGNGSDKDSADCDDEGTLTGSGNVEDGRLELTVTDGDGQQVHEQTYDGNIALEAEKLHGEGGEWTVSVVRVGDDLLGDEFNGDYVFRLDC